MTKKELEVETKVLKDFGLLPHEVEGYFDFYGMWPKSKSIRVINSKKKVIK